MNKFKVGDVVQLPSGGPKMTVTADGTNKGYVHCSWFTSDELRHSDQFAEAALVKVDANVSEGPS